jgi:hypothetical protein
MTILQSKNKMKLKIIISEENQDCATLLRQALKKYADIVVVELSPDKLCSLNTLDAIFLPLAMAERWGAKPLLYKSQILTSELKNKADMPQQDMPPYLVTGVAVPLDQDRNPLVQLELVLNSVFDAIKLFNDTTDNKIQTVGFWARNLFLDQLDPTLVGQIVGSIYQKTIERNMAI